MTPQEALEMVWECGLNIVPPYHDEVLRVIEECIGFRVPKKRIDLVEDFGFRCPTCNAPISSRYCEFCGQAVDWGNEE